MRRREALGAAGRAGAAVRRALGHHWPALTGIVLYCLLSVAFFGSTFPWSTSSLPTCACGDAAQEVWFLAWPAHAIANGLNPFHTDFAAFPHGLDLMSSTSMLLLGTLVAPVTWTLGPVASYNLLAHLSLAGSACSMFLVLRRWTRWWPAAFAGGLLYGFSPYMLAEAQSHIFLIFVPLPPIVLLLGHDLLVRGEPNPVRTGIWLGVVAAAQFLISAEILTMVVIAAAGAVVLLALRHPVAAYERSRRAAIGLGSGAASFLVLAGYPLWYYFRGPGHVTGAQHPALTYYLFHDDLLTLITPTPFQRFGTAAMKSLGARLAEGNLVEHNAYFGVPLLLIVVAAAIWLRRDGIVAVAALVGAGAVLVTLGPTLYVDQQKHLGFLKLPYDLMLHLPLLKGLLAPRLAMVAFLAAAVVLAAGLDRLHEVLKGRAAALAVAVPGLAAVIALLPLVPSGALVAAPLPVPAFFDSAADLGRIPAGSVVLPYPNAQLPATAVAVFPEVRAMLWQATSAFHFKMIGAYAAQTSGNGSLGQGSQLFAAPPIVQQIFGWGMYGTPAVSRPDTTSAGSLQALRLFCHLHHVSTILVDPTVGADPAEVVSYVSAALGRPPEQVGGVDAWFGIDY